MTTKKQEQEQAQKQSQKAASTQAQVSKAQLKAQAEECTAAILEALGKVEDGYFDVCEKLYEARLHNYHEALGYKEWDNFVADRFGMKPRKADYFIGIQKAIVSCKLKRKDLKGIGWSNLGAVYKVLEPETYKDWLAKAKKHSHRELTEMVKIARRAQQQASGEGPSTPPPVIGTLTVRMGEDKLVFIEQALGMACEILQTEDKGAALAHISTEWLEAKGVKPEALTLDQWITFLEGIYPAKISYVEVEEDEDSAAEGIDDDDNENEDDDLLGDNDADEPKGEEPEAASAEDAELDSLLNEDDDENEGEGEAEPELAPEPEKVKKPKTGKKPKKNK